MEIISLSLLLRDTVAFAVLPHAAILASNAMRAIIKILTMDAAYAVEIPRVILLQVLQLLLALLHVGLELSFGDTPTICIDHDAICPYLLQHFLLLL
jgi:hypothetical protein